MKALREMRRGTTATVERKDGEKIDVVIRKSQPSTITVLRQERDPGFDARPSPSAEIAKIKKASVKKMSTTSKMLIGAAVGLRRARRSGPRRVRVGLQRHNAILELASTPYPAVTSRQ